MGTLTEEEIDRICQDYSANNMKKLRQTIFKTVSSLGVTQSDYDDFLSAANLALWQLAKSYDGSKGVPFDAYVRTQIPLKIMQEKKYQGRKKRQQYFVDESGEECEVPLISLNGLIDDESNLCLMDVIPSDFSIEENIGAFNTSDMVESFLENLSSIERSIVEMKMEGIPISSIKSHLGLSNTEYSNYCNSIKRFDNINLLYKKNEKIGEEDLMAGTNTTLEKSKSITYSIASINKKIDNRTVRFDHPLQRESEQWSLAMKSNLISDILQGNPLPEIVFAEQVVNGLPVVWDLDGKQRCTICYAYAHDGFSVSKKIRRYNIQYVSLIKDKNGPILDENNFPVSEIKEFDIRNKKFSQLPEELQERFLDYTFNCIQYLNCDGDEISYHVVRYNEGKKMNPAQKGITRIGEDYALLIKDISKMPFFRDNDKGYKLSEFRNGTIYKVIAESVMLINHFDDWKKSPEGICSYLNQNATTEEFKRFEDTVRKLERVITEDVKPMFNSKDSFLWFNLFVRFADGDGEKFVGFMNEFSRSLHNKMVNGTSWDELSRYRGTRDKKFIEQKMEVLAALLGEYTRKGRR